MAIAAAALAAPAAAQAQQKYPPPGQPGKEQGKPKGPHHTFTVCHKRHRCDFRTIQKAVRHARAGDTVRVEHGTYREAVTISGRGKRYLKLIGDIKHPRRVRLVGRNRDGNAVFVNDADHVTVRGFYAQDYTANGFFITNATGYTLRNLVANHVGTYGIYAFNTEGGLMADSEAYHVNDGAFYIGQTPPQAKPRRTMVRNVSGHDSAIGFSATNMRYVTITRSRFYNNALGVVPNALDSEKYPPPEDNVITGNDIFWNNFDFHKGAPFTIRKDGTAALAPVGTGLLLLGGRGNRVEHNRIFGNYLTGVGAIDGILIDPKKHPDAIALQRNTIRDNAFGRGGTDTNGRDVLYDGSGSNNCFGPNTFTAPTLPASGLPSCPFTGTNAFSENDRNTMVSYIGEGALKAWRPAGHPRFHHYKALEFYKKRSASSASRASAASSRRKTVHVGDNYYAPSTLKVRRGTRVTWKWPSAEEAGDVHDVKLKRAPKGVRHFHSRPAASEYSFTRQLKKAGTYRLVCTLHENMKMTIRVRR